MSALAAYRGRWALVTGGADGIGRALCAALAARGVNVTLVDIRSDPAQETAAALQSTGAAVVPETADVSDRDAMIALAARVRDRGHAPALLWINAGVAAGVGLCEARQRAVEWVFGVNVLGAIWTAQAFAQDLRDGRGARHIGVTCSTASLTEPEGPLTLYQTSKIAAAGVADALRAEFAPYGVGVTSFCPGLLNTMIWDAARARPECFGGPRHQAHETGVRWRAAESPDAAVAVALAAVERGGGYAVAPTAADTLQRFDARVAAQRAGFPEA